MPKHWSNDHTVTEAPDAATALVACRSVTRSFDVVLLDMRLPDSRDLSLVARVRLHPPSGGIVLMTAYGTRELDADAHAVGVREVLAKPFSLRTVCDIIEAVDQGD